MTKPPGNWLTVAQVCDLAQAVTGKRPSPSTVTRWVQRGARGRRLESARFGGRLLIPQPAARQWLADFEPPQLASDDTEARAVGFVLGRPYAQEGGASR